MAARQPTEPTELDALEQHIRELEVQSKALLAEQLGLERQNIQPSEPKPGEHPQSRVAKWMNGFAHPLGANQHRGERLFEVIQARGDIEAAVNELERRRLRLEGDRIAAQAAEQEPAWRALARRIVNWAEEGRHLQAQASAVPTAVRQMLPMGHLGARSIVGINWASDPAGAARREALAAGIISERDLLKEAKGQ